MRTGAMRFGQAMSGALGLGLCLALGGCGKGKADAAPEAPYVQTVLVSGSAAAGAERYTGSVRARIEADLGFRVPGKIAERRVDPGMRVRRGQVLMRLDPTDLGLAAGAAADRLRAAEAEAARAAADEARLKGLVEAGATAAATYDAAVAARKSTAATLAAVRAQAADAANQRGYAALVADSDGVVTEVLAQPGQVVSAGTPVLRLARAGAREALIAVPEAALPRLPRAARATLYATGETVGARLREVAGAADPLTRTYAARYMLAAAPEAAALGSTVTLELRDAAGPAPIEVPLAALTDRGRGPGVWVVGADRRVRRRAVRLVALAEESARLAPGALRPGERIVALGAQLLREGQQVRLAAKEAK